MNTPANAVGAQLKTQCQTNPNAACMKRTKQAPTTRAREKEALVLGWLGVFGMTTTQIVKSLLNIKGDGYLPKLQRDGLVQSRAIGKMAEKAWTLTPAGAGAARRVLGWDVDRVRADRLNVSIATHDTLGQLAAMQLLEHFEDKLPEIRKLTSEHDMKRSLGASASDVVYEQYDEEGRLVWLACEVETNPKGESELTGKMGRLIDLVVRQKRCDRLHVAWYVAGGERVRERYEKIWGRTVTGVRTQMQRDAFPDHAEMQRIKDMAFPTCSYLPLPEYPRPRSS